MQKENMKLTLIIPIYNVEDYLPQCLDSLVAQTNKDFIALLIDDGSTDESGRIAKEYAEKYENFKYFYKENGGLSSARNYGLERVTTEWVGFIDSDDFVDVNFVELMLDNSNNVDMVVCGIKRFYSKQKVEYISGGLLEGRYHIKQIFPECIVANRILPFAWNKIYKLSIFKDNNIEFPFGLYHEDVATILKCFFYSSNCKFIDACIYNYRINLGSITNSYSEKKLLDRFVVMSNNKIFLEKNI